MKKSEITNTCVAETGEGKLVCFLEEDGILCGFTKENLFYGGLHFYLSNSSIPEILERATDKEFCITAIKKFSNQSEAIFCVLNNKELEKWDWKKKKIDKITKEEAEELIAREIGQIVKIIFKSQ